MEIQKMGFYLTHVMAKADQFKIIKKVTLCKFSGL